MPDLPDIPKAEAAIVALTNAFRSGEKLAPVKPNTELARAARLFAEYLARTGRFAHEADGRKPGERARAAGYRFCSLSENLASHLDSRGFTTERLAERAVEGWKNSPGHRRNLADPSATEIGVGIARAPDRDPKFIAVQLLARPESLRSVFRIENRTETTVSYRALGKAHTLAPRVTATHSACASGEIVFERSGGWFTGQQLHARFEARDGAHYVLSTGRDGRVRVDLHPAAR
jgi:hypothetical protein